MRVSTKLKSLGTVVTVAAGLLTVGVNYKNGGLSGLRELYTDGAAVIREYLQHGSFVARQPEAHVPEIVKTAPTPSPTPAPERKPVETTQTPLAPSCPNGSVWNGDRCTAASEPPPYYNLPPDLLPPGNIAPDDPRYGNTRREVSFRTVEPPGTIIVDTPNKYLYYVLGSGRAIRYLTGVGSNCSFWTGVVKITSKEEWPDWHAPPPGFEVAPWVPKFMAGGPGNPLGARAIYLDTVVHRIHGTNHPSQIGGTLSLGCIGMLNEDVSDIYDRVKIGGRVIKLPSPQ
jgi:lipoprotein-anchoring transpeptidase ErfK/SrfK